MAKDTYFYALGRRKSATARVRLQSGKGVVTINGKTAEEYLAGSLRHPGTHAAGDSLAGRDDR
jgi:ribosomal protein S9